MKIFREKGDDGKSFIHGIRHNGSLWQLLYDFLQAYKDRTEALKGTPPIGETTIAQKLDAIVEMLRSQAGVAPQLDLIKEELSTIHGLIADLVSADPEKIEEVTARIKAVREKLQTSVDNQTKGD